MTDICERRVVHCPNPEASDYLAAFVADHHGVDGTVRLPISRLSNRRPLIERHVVATVYPLKSIGSLHPTYSVTWLPKDGGPSPEFAGALAVVKSPCEDCFGLILTGHSKPRGAVDAMCDAIRGRRIARVSARNVLRAIATYVENARAHNEAALAGHGPLTYLSVTRSQRRVDADSDLQRMSDVGRQHPGHPR